MSKHTVSRRSIVFVCVGALGLAACADPQEKQSEATVTRSEGGDAARADVVRYDTSPEQAGRIKGVRDARLAAKVPAKFRKDGTLTVATAAAAGGTPPLSFLASDNKTPAGVEADIGYLLGDILGLKPRFGTTSFENTFVGVDSGRYEVALSNIGVSEDRKKKYDFATYRSGLHAFEVRRDSTLKVRSSKDLAG